MGYGVKTMPFLRDGKLVKRYCPRVRIEGDMCFIKDNNSLSGVIECVTREEARDIAKINAKEVKESLQHGLKFKRSFI